MTSMDLTELVLEPPALVPVILSFDLGRIVAPLVLGWAKDKAEHDFFHWDIETRSAAVLGRGKLAVGARAYAQHPTTEVLCVAFARGNGPVELWVPGEPISSTILEAAADSKCRWVAHNASFERAILEHVLVPKHAWPVVSIEKHLCTQALVLAHAYPASLEGAADALGLVNRKDAMRGKKVKKMWSPRKPKKGEDLNVLHWHDNPELRAELHSYNRQDVAAERELHQKLLALPPAEQDAWVIDQEVNDLGVVIDTTLASAASRMTARALEDLNEQMCEATEGVVETASKVQQLKAWLKAQGVVLPQRPKKLRKGVEWQDCLEEDDITRLLVDPLPSSARAALKIRAQAGQTAPKKFDKMLNTRCADGRVRNLYRFSGALTGRWSGESFQPQNLKRPEILRTDTLIEEAMRIVLAGDYERATSKYGDVLRMLGDLGRSMLVPAPDCRFIVGDFSTIEARTLALLAGDFDKLTRFRNFDAGIGRDSYCLVAEQVLGFEYVDPKSPERQLGKTFELGLGYQMGSGRLLATIRKARVPGTENATEADTETWVNRWREANPKVVEYWRLLDAAALYAVRNPGEVVPCRLLSFHMREGELALRLPSGRELHYPAPSIGPGRFGRDQVAFLDMEAGRRRGRQMYGGAWAENVASAVARDLLVEAMKRLRSAGYVLVMHTHDEIVSEMPYGQGDIIEFKRLLIEAPVWVDPALPISAKVFEADRLKKD